MICDVTYFPDLVFSSSSLLQVLHRLRLLVEGLVPILRAGVHQRLQLLQQLLHGDGGQVLGEEEHHPVVADLRRDTYLSLIYSHGFYILLPDLSSCAGGRSARPPPCSRGPGRGAAS